MKNAKVTLSLEAKKIKEFKKIAIDLGITLSDFFESAVNEKIEAEPRLKSLRDGYRS